MESLNQKVGSFFDLKRQSRVDNIRRRESIVNIAGLRSNEFSHGGCEGDDIVFDLFLDFLNTGDIKVGLGLYGGERVRGNDAGLRQNFAGGNLNSQPLAIPVFFGPDGAHRGARVASDQAATLLNNRG